MRPIVSFCGSPTYELSKCLTTILQPLTDKSRRKLQSTQDFIDAIKTTQIPDDYKLVSFDVKSLSTSMPLQLECTERTAIRQSTVTLPLPTEDIINLLNLCLTSTYFQYNRKHYKQTEHKRATRNGDVNNHIAEHHRLTNQTIDCTMFNLQH